MASGIPGGLFTPTPPAGAALGAIAVNRCPYTAPAATRCSAWPRPSAASIQAPLTAAVMVFELTGDSPALPLIS